MLTQLRLAGIGVIDSAALEFGPGLNAVTGETGAGKTMVVAGLGQLLGSRADAGMVRHGADRAVVEGLWQVADPTVAQVTELGGDCEDNEVVVMRQITAQGRSRAIIGGATVPVSRLAEVTGELATIHGQSEQVRLSSSQRQREVLDAYAKPAELAAYHRDYAAHAAAAAELAQLLAGAETARREAEALQHDLAEIEAADPQPGEDEQLAREATLLQDVEELRQLAGAAQQALSGNETDFDQPNAISLLASASDTLTALAARDERLTELAARIRDAAYNVNDAATEVASYATNLEADPIRLEAISERRAVLQALCRKHGPQLDQVLAFAAAARDKLATLGGVDDQIAALQHRVAELDEALTVAATSITAARQAAAEKLAAAIQPELASLAMPQARLEFQLTPIERGPHGQDQVEIVFTANPGVPPAPLRKVASGGELSRVRLALEVVLADQLAHQTFVFDEIDAGVGGAVGLEIGRRLQRLAQHCQVIVVTHLAQVAAFADSHFVITKSDDSSVTTSGIRRVSDADRAAELARMMGGSADSESGLAHAADLLRSARG